jgi:hypothetical protein
MTTEGDPNWQAAVWQRIDRELIAEGKKHDEAMTEGPRGYDGERGRVYGPGPNQFLHKDVCEMIVGNHNRNAAGIAWLGTHCRELLTGYDRALDEVERLTITQDRLVARIAATDAPADIEATLATLDGARDRIAALQAEIGEAKLVIEQQDRDMQRIRALLSDLRTPMNEDRINAILEGKCTDATKAK